MGAAYVFHVAHAGSWASSDPSIAILRYAPDPVSDGPAPDEFGSSFALSADGTTAFVGAPQAGCCYDPPGAIYVFHVSTEDAWISSYRPTATLSVYRDYVGGSLAVSSDGTTLVAGAPGLYYNYHDAGGAYVFHASSEHAWASSQGPIAGLTNADEPSKSMVVGNAVAISGDGTTVLLGESRDGSDGGAYVYHVPTEDAWAWSSTPNAILTNADSGVADALGDSVALSGDGTVALLGAPGASSNTGAVYVFHTPGAAAWAPTSQPTATLTNAAGSPGDMFGLQVLIAPDGRTALVGASGRHGMRGAAYTFRLSDEGAWVSSSASTAVPA